MKTNKKLARWWIGLPRAEQLAIAFTLGCLVAWGFALILIKLWS